METRRGGDVKFKRHIKLVVKQSCMINYEKKMI